MIKFTKEDIERFSKEVCLDCHCKENCEKSKLRKEMCGKFFNWKIGYSNWVIEYCKDSIKNPKKYNEEYKNMMKRKEKWNK